MSKETKWQVEYIGSQANILVSDESKSPVDLNPVGMGFPIKLAENIVEKHNAAYEALRAELERVKTDRDEWKASSVRKFSEIEALTLEIGRVKGELVFSELQLKTVREQRGDFMVMNDALESELESTKAEISALKDGVAALDMLSESQFKEIETTKRKLAKAVEQRNDMIESVCGSEQNAMREMQHSYDRELEESTNG